MLTVHMAMRLEYMCVCVCVSQFEGWEGMSVCMHVAVYECKSECAHM